jgi:hypothetical protein
MSIRKTSTTVIDERLPQVRMWLEDLKEVAFWIMQIPSEEALVIEMIAKGTVYQLDSIEDLADFEMARIEEIYLAHPEKALTVSFGKQKNRVTYRDDRPEVIASATQVKVVVRRHRRLAFVNFFTGTAARQFLSLTALLLICGSYVLVSQLLDDRDYTATEQIRSGFMGLLAAAVFWSLVLGVRPWESRIFTKTRAMLPTFWQRKRDDLFLTIASNAVSLIAGGAIGYWVNTLS